MASNKTLIGATIILLICLGIITFKDAFQGRFMKKHITLPPNINQSKEPIFTLSGEITDIKGKTVIIKKTFASGNDTKDTFESQSYTIVVNDTTRIYQPEPSGLIFFFSTPPSISEKNLSIKDIGVGRFIEVTSQTDLKTLPNNTIQAKTIELARPVVAIKGKVALVTPTTLTLETDVSPDTFGADPKPQVKKTLQFQLSENTEISRMSPLVDGTTPTPQRFSLGDIKPGMNVAVITDKDVFTSSHLTALRIEPLE